jgi:hypothetical protein
MGCPPLVVYPRRGVRGILAYCGGGIAEAVGEDAGAAGVIGGCIVFPPHFAQIPGEVDTLVELDSGFVLELRPFRLLRRG